MHYSPSGTGGGTIADAYSPPHNGTPRIVTLIPKRTTSEQVREFMLACDQTVSPKPAWPSAEDYRLRVRLDVEENMEKFHHGYYKADALQILDGSCDSDVVVTGSDLTFGFDHDAAIAEVHRSNMTKVDPATGKATKDAGGKVLKPAGYSPPNLLPFVGELANTKPEYDTQSIVREEFTKSLAKHIDMVDFELLADILVERMLSAASPRSTNERQALKFMAYVGKVKVFDAGVLNIGEAPEEAEQPGVIYLPKQTEPQDDSSAEVSVTDEMVDVGMIEFREHRYGGDDRYMIECVYRAMTYARLRASSTNAAR